VGTERRAHRFARLDTGARLSEVPVGRLERGATAYVLGLGSPTHPLPNESYGAWTASYRWKKLYGIEFLYGGPLFVHQLSHVWIDFRAIQDDFTRDRGLDYFENSRRAT
jgi:hypothetical protein